MPKLRSILPASLALALSVAPANAQLTPLQDPANLAGERVSPQDPADTLPLNHGAPALQQLLAKLRTRASLMLIVAHPDDEDGGLLTYESRGQGARVAMLTLTRGEGGQNLMSADFDDALGLIRTQELLAADRYFGVDQFFGTEVDFGFSKTKEESFQKWTHDRVLYDAVRAVRLYRPLVIASVFVGGPTDGHGQHQVAGEIAQEVFVAAADPEVFPEMGLPVWAPLKVYARVPFSRVTPEGMFDYATGKTIPTRFHNYVTGEDSTAVPTATVLIHEGDKPSDPTLAAAMGGDTFLQFARKGLALQKTQIGPNARLAPAGTFDAPYTLMASRVDCINTKAGCPTFATASSSLRWASPKPTTEQSLFDGIDTSLSGIANLAPDAPASLRSTLEKLDKNLADAQRLFDPAHTEVAASSLTEAIKIADDLIRDFSQTNLGPTAKEYLLHELRIKRVQLGKALLLSSGINNTLETIATKAASSSQGFVTLPDQFRISTHGEYKGSSEVRFMGTRTAQERRPFAPSYTGGPVKPSLDAFFNLKITDGPRTQPYFSRLAMEQPFYTVSIPALRNSPVTPFPLVGYTDLRYQGVDLVTAQALTLNHLPIAVVPPVSVSISPRVGITTAAGTRFRISVDVQRYGSDTKGGVLKLDLPAGWTSSPATAEIAFKDGAEPTRATFTVTPGTIAPNTKYVLTAVAEIDGAKYTESFRPVGYPGIPYTNFYTPATYRATAVDLQTAPNLHIAYLPGTGDPVPDLLPNLGITPTILSLKDLNATTLNKYNAVLLGVRAYAAHPALAGPGSQPLLDYAKQGGVVILQYNTARYGDAEAPFPIDVPGDSAHNVVEEAQPVTLLHPDAPLLTWPNRITAADFDNWVAERGHGFAASWSPQFQPLLETHDVGQDAQQGGLLLARTGKGTYIYCALALYRQLPEGVPGAYRLLANLLSLAKNPGFQAH